MMPLERARGKGSKASRFIHAGRKGGSLAFRSNGSIRIYTSGGKSFREVYDVQFTSKSLCLTHHHPNPPPSLPKPPLLNEKSGTFLSRREKSYPPHSPPPPPPHIINRSNHPPLPHRHSRHPSHRSQPPTPTPSSSSSTSTSTNHLPHIILLHITITRRPMSLTPIPR